MTRNADSNDETKKPIHPSITADRVVKAVEMSLETLEDPGFCLACGEDALGVEPDARCYECEYCRAPCVYGAEEVLLMTIA